MMITMITLQGMSMDLNGHIGFMVIPCINSILHFNPSAWSDEHCSS